jgi:hypothetical protein
MSEALHKAIVKIPEEGWQVGFGNPRPSMW